MLAYEGVIIENPNLKADWARSLAFPEDGMVTISAKPDGVLPIAPGNSYDEYRRGRDSACVDAVVATVLENGEPAVLLSFRKPNVCYGSTWWIYGGALQSYTSIEEFISGRVSKECGVPVRPGACIGVYRTMSHDFVGSTLQPCYAIFVPIQVIRAKMATDDGHSSIRLFTLEELPQEGDMGYHWYPTRVAKKALMNMPQTNGLLKQVGADGLAMDDLGPIRFQEN